MINILPILILVGSGIIILLLSIGISFYSKKLGKLYRDNRRESKKYSRDLTIGIVSAMTVVVLDKIVTLVIKGIPNLHLDTSSILSFFASGLGIIIDLVLVSLFLLLCLLFLIYSGFPKNRGKYSAPIK